MKARRIPLLMLFSLSLVAPVTTYSALLSNYQQTTPPYLSDFPSVERVLSVMKTRNASFGNANKCTVSPASGSDRVASLNGTSIRHSRSYDHLVPFVMRSASPSIVASETGGSSE
jgi:hypothetical protein